MGDPIRFLLGDEERALGASSPTLTVLEYLRRHERRTGTKEGCAEGDCGACTVVLAEPDGEGGLQLPRGQFLHPVPADAATARQLITVEDLQHADGTLHPVQQAMVDRHGSQCGFCTPGFVMSLYAGWHGRAARGPAERSRTGSPAISAAAPAMARSSRPAEIGAAPRDGAAADARPRGRLAALDDGACCTSCMASSNGSRRARPTSWPTLYRQHPGRGPRRRRDRCRPVGHQAAPRPRTDRRFIGDIAELAAIEEDEDGLTIGAAVTLSRRDRGARPAPSRSRRADAPLRLASRSATPGRSAATSPTARRSATCRRR